MFATPAMAQTAAPAASGGADGIAALLQGPLPLMAVMFALFYFMLLRPQQRAMKQHKEAISAIKRGDTVVLNSGVIGKVAKVEDAEVQVDIAPNVSVRVVKAKLAEVRTRGEPQPANDAKS
jgi:preprotein translocase subunit YajC